MGGTGEASNTDKGPDVQSQHRTLSTLSLMRSWEYPAKDNSGGSWQADDLKKTMGPRKRGHMNETDSSSSQIAEGEMNQQGVLSIPEAGTLGREEETGFLVFLVES